MAERRWMQSAKTVPLSELAGHLNIVVGRMRSMGPCPACGESQRGSEDRRKPVGPTRDGKGWQCHRCGVKGDGVELVAYKVLGRSCRDASGDDWKTLEAWFSERGLLSGSSEKRTGHPVIHSTAAMTDRILGRHRRSNAPRGSSKASEGSGVAEGAKTSRRSRGVRFQWRDGLADECADALWTDAPLAKAALEYLIEHRKIPEDTIREFGIGVFVSAGGGEIVTCKQGRPYLTIPLAGADERVVNVRFRSVPVPGTCEHCDSPLGCRKCKEYRVCEGRPLPLFGAQNLGNDLDGPVIITEGELDVLAMHAYGYTVSVVSGTAGATAEWKDDWLDLLEPYSQFIGLYDDDEKGEEGWLKLAEKLGVYRCSKATLPHNDAGECLMQGVERDRIVRAVDRAKPMVGLELRKVDSYADQLEILIEHPELLRGVPTGSDKLDEALGGWRPGVVVVTGETGEGKTTFATWVMKQQAALGFAGVVTSFEQTPIGTVQKLLRAEVGGDFTLVSKDDRLDALERLGRLPLHILDHYGHMPPAKIVELVRYAKRRHGCTRFMLDHLGFLVDPDADDERRAIEAVIRALAILAYTEEVLLFLIAHPHNTQQHGRGYHRVTLRNLKGAAAIRQDASEVIVVTAEPPNKAKGRKVNRPWPQSRFFLDKVRSDFGVSGAELTLAFDPGSCVYADAWDDTPAGKKGLVVPGARTVRENQEKK